jgi:hypothetical protein
MFTGDQFYGGFLEYGYNKVPVIRGPGGHFYSAPRGSKPTKQVAGTHFLQRAAQTAASQAVEGFTKKLAELVVKEKAKVPTTK